MSRTYWTLLPRVTADIIAGLVHAIGLTLAAVAALLAVVLVAQIHADIGGGHDVQALASALDAGLVLETIAAGVFIALVWLAVVGMIFVLPAAFILTWFVARRERQVKEVEA